METCQSRNLSLRNQVATIDPKLSSIKINIRQDRRENGKEKCFYVSNDPSEMLKLPGPLFLDKIQRREDLQTYSVSVLAWRILQSTVQGVYKKGMVVCHFKFH